MIRRLLYVASSAFFCLPLSPEWIVLIMVGDALILALKFLGWVK
jgi:hypothetical protein